MLSIGKLNQEQAGKYFASEKEQYYSGENSEARYGGKANSLTGTTLTKENFKSFIAKSKHKINSFDLTFSAPKSLSILAETADEELRNKLINLHTQASDIAMQKIEKDATFRLFFTNEDGQREYVSVPAQGLAYASFLHHASRMQDPQLHSHNVILNKIMHNNKEYSIDARYFYQNQKEYSKLYRGELINLLINNNINVKITDFENLLFEIQGISAEDISNFSKQSKNIDAVIEDLKKQYPAADIKELREQANLSTRAAKNHSIKIEDLRASWKKELQNEIKTEPTKFEKPTQKDYENSYDKASEKLTEFQSTFSSLELKNAIKQDLLINKKSFDENNINAIIDEKVKSKDLINIDDTYTTKEMQEAEKYIANFAQEKSNREPLMSLESAKIAIENWEKNNFKLTAGQLESVEKVLNGNAQFFIFQGDAGVGKTAALKALNDILLSQNSDIMKGLSTTGKAAAEIQSASNIESLTLDSFLLKTESEQNKIYIIDESSMTSTTKLKRIAEIAKLTNSVVILQGDIKQLPAIEAGGVFEYCLNDKNIEKTVNEESMRQKDLFLKDVVKTIARGDATSALNKLDSAGKILEFESKEELYHSIAKAYVAKKDDKNLILAQRNIDRKEINNIVRNLKKEKNEISRDDETVLCKTSKNFSNYQKKYSYNYKKDDIIISKKKQYTVEKIDEDKNLIYVKNESGKIEIIKPDSKLEIYNNELKNYSVNDKIVFLKNSKIGNEKVKNGHIGFIQNIEKDEAGARIFTIKTENGKIIKFNEKQYNYIDNAYAITDYKSQGQTCPEVLIYSDGGTKENLYVELSRAKNNAEIFTLDKDKLYIKSEITKRQISSIQKFKDLLNEKEILNKLLHKDNKNIDNNKENTNTKNTITTNTKNYKNIQQEMTL
jgi:conjugative relaxase-like TrwC/TraI family protein